MGIFRKKPKIVDEPIKINDFLFTGSYVKDITYFSKFTLLPVDEIYYKTYINPTADKIMKNLRSYEKNGFIIIDKTTNVAYLTKKGKALLTNPKFSQMLLEDMLGNISGEQIVLSKAEAISLKSANKSNDVSSLPARTESHKREAASHSVSSGVYKSKSTLTQTESNFYYEILKPIIESYGYEAQFKIPMQDLVDVVFKSDISSFNKISQKHIDFGVYPKGNSRPVFLIELDDSTHKSDKVQQKDMLKDEIFASIGIPLERVLVSDKKQRITVATLCRKHLQKYILKISFHDKDKAKGLGARWDNDNRTWYTIGIIDAQKICASNLGKIVLDVEFNEKDSVKELGAKWDNDIRKWCVVGQFSYSDFEKWFAVLDKNGTSCPITVH